MKFYMEDVIYDYLDTYEGIYVPGGGMDITWFEHISEDIIEALEEQIEDTENEEDLEYYRAKRKFVEANASDIDELGRDIQRGE